MQKMTTGEKMNLLRYHGECLARSFTGIGENHKDEMLDHAERAIALIKSIPKIEFSIEQ